MSAMHRAAIAAVFLLPVVASAAESGGPDLGEVVVSATRSATPIEQLGVPAIVITREQLEQSLATDVTELLAAQPGIEVSHSGGPGQTVSLFLRGSDSNHTAVLIDGVRINPGTIGGAALQNIPPENIERIEIVKGARSTLYGSDAVGGVINIVTRAGAAHGVGVTAAAGRYNMRTAAADGGTEIGNLGVGASIAWRDSDGFPPRTNSASSGAYRNTGGNLALRYAASDELSWRAQAWRSAGRNDYDNFGTQAVQNFVTASYATGLEWQRGTSNWRAQLNRIEDDIQQQLSPDYARTRRNALELQAGWALGEHQQLTAGTVLSRENTAALSFGTQFDVDTDVQLYYLQDQVQFGGNRLLLALGHTHHETFGNHATWNVEINRSLGTLSWRAAAGTGFHAPDSTDRFGFGGNPNLKPESSRQLEAGVVWRIAASQSLQLDAFENRISDLVDYVITDFITFDGHNENVARARIRGIEASYLLQRDPWRLRISATRQEPRDLTNDTQLLRRARHNAAIDLQHRSGPLTLSTQLLMVGARKDAGFPAAVDLPSYTLLGVAAIFALSPEWSIETRIDNAFDHDYEQIRGYRTAGRSITLAARWQRR